MRQLIHRLKIAQERWQEGIWHERIQIQKVAVSGKKRTQKLYRRHSGRPGGMTVETFDQLQNRIPERIIEHAVRGMLPKGRDQYAHGCTPDKIVTFCCPVHSLKAKSLLVIVYSKDKDVTKGWCMQLGRTLFTRLKVYSGPDHPHEAQQPIDLPIRDKRIQLQR
ncbi:hypothetical protein TSUD_370140 [Trifolium subterraneum]|uniref:Ribosomal protein L13 n=1 Tax=Trifolium subterraneum TaxID=3900 RepID=A0A2Z6MTE3_TRISU|nr:hypothetical protein TSUD_370140 [Trifolium subterraneum]